MKYADLNCILEKRFPHLSSRISHYLNMFDGSSPGSHILYGNVLSPYVKELLKSDRDPTALSQVFSFYEELAQSSDIEVRNLLQVTLLEGLWDEKILLNRASHYMLPETRRINDYIREYLSIPLD